MIEKIDSGRVTEIGGIINKIVFYSSGFKIVLLPSRNQDDVKDIPKEVLDDKKDIFCRSII
jgi:ATP-dependent Lon protease